MELGCVSAIDSNGRTIWIADAHRDDGKRFVVHADEKLTAFLELESAKDKREARLKSRSPHETEARTTDPVQRRARGQALPPPGARVVAIAGKTT